MPKRAVSVTLETDNLLWLRGQARGAPRRSLSEVLDRLVTEGFPLEQPEPPRVTVDLAEEADEHVTKVTGTDLLTVDLVGVARSTAAACPGRGRPCLRSST